MISRSDPIRKIQWVQEWNVSHKEVGKLGEQGLLAKEKGEECITRKLEIWTDLLVAVTCARCTGMESQPQRGG